MAASNPARWRRSRGAGIAEATTRKRLQRLAARGCVKFLQRNSRGITLQVIAPSQISGRVPASTRPPRLDLETANCFRDPKLRRAILRREAGRCFYCLREIRGRAVVFDHVVPRARGGGNSYRNIVACCQPCNAGKSRRSAADFLRILYRTNRLTRAELDARLAALQSLQRGQRKPRLSR